MLERLFSSKTRVEILGRMLLHPERGFHARELERAIGPGSYRSVWLELKNLERLGLLAPTRIGRTVQYRVNPESPLVPELTELFRKNWAAGELIGEAIKSAGDIGVAFIHGSFATGKFGAKSDIDLVVIGVVDAHRLDSALAAVESKLGRELNYRLFKPREWIRELQSGTPFLREVMGGRKLFVIGGPRELEEMGG